MPAPDKLKRNGINKRLVPVMPSIHEESEFRSFSEDWLMIGVA
jgi:hypothetical protein